MYIYREISKKILRMAKEFPALLLSGARQTGKTTLVKHLFPKHHWVSLDLPSVAELAEQNPEQFFLQFPPPVIIDEVQYAPKLFRYLKLKIDQERQKKSQYILTGSQKFSLMQNVSESLAGRCAFAELDTCSFHEVKKQYGKSPTKKIEFLIRGGFPELMTEAHRSASDFYHAYLATYLERDIRSLVQVGNLRDFERFIRMCALRTAQLINLSEISRDVGISATSAKQWLSILEASNQIYLLEPYFSNQSKRMVKTPKIFWRETGLLCFLLGIQNQKQLQNSPMLGFIWENFLLGQILRGFQKSSPNKTLWYWRDRHGLEVDFLIEQGSQLTLLEAKWSENPSLQDAVNLQKVSELYSPKLKVIKAILSRVDQNHPLSKNIKAINGFEIQDYLKL